MVWFNAMASATRSLGDYFACQISIINNIMSLFANVSDDSETFKLFLNIISEWLNCIIISSFLYCRLYVY